jgi:hypothetical protein
MKIRCSALPRILSCPQSRHAPAVDIDGPNEASTLGTAAHEIAAQIVQGRPWDVALTATDYQCDEKELGFLAHNIKAIWERLTGAEIIVEEVEAEMEAKIAPDIFLSGHADVIAQGAERVIIDWKSQRKECDVWPQLKGYALLDLYLSSPPLSENILEWKLVVAWLRSGTWETRTVIPTQLDEFKAKLIAACESDRYNPSEENCETKFCPRRHECPAHAALTKVAIHSLSTIPPAEMTPQALAELYPEYRIVKKVCDEYDKAIKLTLESAGGKMTLADGRALELIEEPRENIASAIGAFEVLKAAGIAEENIWPALTMGKTKLLDAIAATASKGEKKAAKESVMQALREAGAIEQTVVKKLSLGKGTE